LATGSGPFFLGGHRADEQPEDVVAEMLADDGLDSKRRDAIVQSLGECGLRMMSGRECVSAAQGFSEFVRRWANVIDLATPPELKGLVKALPVYAMNAEAFSSRDLLALVRAVVRYRITPEDKSFWVPLLEREETCAFAFTSLLKIDPVSPDLAGSLSKLWLRNVRDGWSVNLPLLTALFLRKKGNQYRLKSALVQVLSDDPAAHRLIRSRMLESRIRRVRAFAQKLPAEASLGEYFVTETYSDFVVPVETSARRYTTINQSIYGSSAGSMLHYGSIRGQANPSTESLEETLSSGRRSEVFGNIQSSRPGKHADEDLRFLQTLYASKVVKKAALNF